MDARSEIRELLTSRRARRTAAAVGLPAYGVRRVPGLRREEVAVLAGVSVPYYTRLERGDLAGASDSVLDGLARALQLDDAERAHLFDLARAAHPLARPRRRRPPRHRIRPSVQQVLDAMTGAAAHIGNDRLDLLGANPLGRALFPEMFDGQERPNAARFVFSTRAPACSTSTGTASPAMWSPLRARPPAVRPRIGTSASSSASCRRAARRSASTWARHDVRFHISTRRSATIFTYTADPGTRSADALALLGSLAATRDAERASAAP